ncbi:MAG: elongation factor G [Chloroflexi bacterium]|nr:elongation factor G [Chloroflexota bacterium]
MKSHVSDQLRNVALLGHGSSGKTSLAEALYHATGATNRLGRVEEGNTVSDYDAEEIRRHISINLAVLPCEWGDYKVNVIDTPGYQDFLGEVVSAIWVATGSLVLVDAVAGPEVGTEMVWRYAAEADIPRMVVINKMDRENANHQKVLEQLTQTFGQNFVPLQLPIGTQAGFKGVVDLVSMKAYIGPDGTKSDIPANLKDAAQEQRTTLMEYAAETDDELVMKYLEGQELTEEEIRRGLAAGVSAGKFIPVLYTSASATLGIQALLDEMVTLLPPPTARTVQVIDPAKDSTVKLECKSTGPLAVAVFKTMADPFVGKLTYLRVYSGTLNSDSRVYNSRSGEEERIGTLYYINGKDQEPVKQLLAGDIGAVSKLNTTATGDTLCDRGRPLILPPPEFPKPLYAVAIFPKTQTDMDKMGPALQRLLEEDPTLKVVREVETGQTVLWGMGDLHVDVAVKKTQQKFGVDITTDVPRIAYRETITKTIQTHGRHKKQTGGRGQFGDVWIRFEPLPRGSGFEFADEIFGGSVPRQYIPAVEKGLREVVDHGVIAGYPTVDFKAALYDGSYHPVDSSEMSFKLAAHLAFREGVTQAGPIILEPIYNLTVTVPEQYTGDVVGDLNSKRGRLQGVDQQSGKGIITAQAPLAELMRYSTDLRSMTQGRGIFTLEFDHYEEVPAHLVPKIVEESKKLHDKEHE